VSGVAFSACGTYLLRPLNRSIFSLGGWVGDLGVYDNAKGTFNGMSEASETSHAALKRI
jgi:hypothetical protein